MCWRCSPFRLHMQVDLILASPMTMPLLLMPLLYAIVSKEQSTASPEAVLHPGGHLRVQSETALCLYQSWPVLLPIWREVHST